MSLLKKVFHPPDTGPHVGPYRTPPEEPGVAVRTPLPRVAWTNGTDLRIVRGSGAQYTVERYVSTTAVDALGNQVITERWTPEQHVRRLTAVEETYGRRHDLSWLIPIFQALDEERNGPLS